MNAIALVCLVLVYFKGVDGEKSEDLEPCAGVASEGSAYTFEQNIHNLTDKLRWTLDNGDVTVVECDANRQPPCRSRVDPTLYSGSMESDRDGHYKAVLTIHRVSRNTDATAWQWFDGRKLIGECDLDVQYKPIVVTFKADTRSQRLTVWEGEIMYLWCDAEGNPRPTITMKGQRSKEYVKVQETMMGKHTTRGGGKKTMGCNDTDTFVCTAKNSLGAGVGEEIAMYVKCSPEILPWWVDRTRNFSVSNGTDLVIKLPITSYPEPTQYTLVKLVNGSSLTREEVSQEKYHVFYEPGVPPTGTIVLRMFRLDGEDIGQFVLTVGNRIIKALDYSFNVNITHETLTAVTEADRDSDELFTTSLIVGMSLALGLVMCCLCFMFGIVGMQVWDKQQKKAEEYAKSKNERKVYDEYQSPLPSSRCLHPPHPAPPSSSPPPLPLLPHPPVENEETGDFVWYKSPRRHSSSDELSTKPSILYDVILPRMQLDDNDNTSAKSTTVYWHDSTLQNSSESLTKEEDSSTECSTLNNNSTLDSFANRSYKINLERSPSPARYQFPRSSAVDRSANNTPTDYLVNDESLEFLYNKSKPESTVSESVDEDGYEIPASRAKKDSPSNRLHGRYVVVDLSPKNHYTQLEVVENSSE